MEENETVETTPVVEDEVVVPDDTPFEVPDDFELQPAEVVAEEEPRAQAPPAPQPVPENDPLAAAKKMFEDKLMSGNAGEAFTLAAVLGAQLAEQRIAERLARQGASTNRSLALEAVRAKKEENPRLFKAIEKELIGRINSVPDGQLAAATRQQVIEAVEYEYQRAAGKVLLGLQKRRAAPATVVPKEEETEPPEYNAPAPPKGKAPKTLSDEDKTTVLIGKLAGLSEEDIMTALRS